jgi:serine/threonine protein phosphatase 1
MYPSEISGKVVVLGDTHGDRKAASTMLRYLVKHKIIQDRWVVFLGDFCDVGPDTAGLISLLLRFRKYHPQTTFLMANHDLNLCKALNIIESPHHEFYWNRIAERNREVLRSYQAKDGEELLKNMPPEHRQFLGDLPWVIEHPDYLFVHCGFDPDEPLDGQIEAMKKRDPTIYKPKWLHKDDLGFVGNSHQTDKIIVAGHLNQRNVMAFDNRVMIDTGAGYGGPLTALLLPEMEYLQTE